MSPDHHKCNIRKYQLSEFDKPYNLLDSPKDLNNILVVEALGGLLNVNDFTIRQCLQTAVLVSSLAGFDTIVSLDNY